jgi:FKBP-type peptidyl-prolyl cis-trans isomerase
MSKARESGFMVRPMVFMIWATVLAVSPATAGEPAALKTEQDKVDYSIGVSLGNNLKLQGGAITLDIVVQGMKDAYSGGKLLMADDEIRAIMAAFQADVRRKRMQALAKASEENRKAGELFLLENRKKDGVVALQSGLQYRVLKKGEGKKPSDTDTVEVNYQGSLIDGTVFDKSAPGAPVAFKLPAVIMGWREALRLMSAGSKWQLFIPPQLAYGERGTGAIGPNATLIFEVELVSVR